MTDENIDQRLRAIEKRNVQVGLDKAWETSFTRRCLIIIFTYLAIALYFWSIGIAKPWINAVVPALGFLLSSLTLPFFRKIWEKYLT